MDTNSMQNTENERQPTGFIPSGRGGVADRLPESYSSAPMRPGVAGRMPSTVASADHSARRLHSQNVNCARATRQQPTVSPHLIKQAA